MPRILIANGAPGESQEGIVKHAGGRTNCALFREALGAPMPGLEFFTLNVADGECLPQGLALLDFDGVAISGSPLNVYDHVPAVTRQIEFAREVFNAGVPCFGSCWGLQLMTAALGGTVRPNPNGREFGIARNIALTEAGRDHPLFAGKEDAFDAITSHEDEIAALPAGSTVLAANAASRIQAAEITSGDKSFWGVQYHPEFDLAMIAALLERRAARLIDEGFARTAEDVGCIVADLRALDAEPRRKDLAWRHGITANILDPLLRRRECANWLETKVVPCASARV